MGRRLHDVVCIISTLLCLVCLAFWVRGYSVLDALKWRQPEMEIALASSRGAFGMRLITLHEPDASWSPRLFRESTQPSPLLQESRQVTRFMGFGYLLLREPRWSIRRVVVPCWAVAVASAIQPMLWVRRRYKIRQRRRSGLCVRCGYDLRATNDCCPECGAPKLAPLSSISRRAT